MLIKTSPPSRQIERMFQKRDWRWRHAYHRQTDADLVQPMATDISAVAAIELGLAKEPRRSARIGKTADRSSMPARNIRFQSVARHREDGTAAPC